MSPRAQVVRATFCVNVSSRFFVFCLLVVPVKLSVLAKLLASKTPLRKPTRSKEIISTNPKLKSTYDFSVFVYCFIILLCVCLVPGPT